MTGSTRLSADELCTLGVTPPARVHQRDDRHNRYPARSS
jgi:hypothetical protein